MCSVCIVYYVLYALCIHAHEHACTCVYEYSHTCMGECVCVCVHVYMTNYSFTNKMVVNYTSVMYMLIDQYLMS